MDYKWSGLEQKWIGSRKLNFLPTPNHIIQLIKNLNGRDSIETQNFLVLNRSEKFNRNPIKITKIYHGHET